MWEDYGDSSGPDVTSSRGGHGNGTTDGKGFCNGGAAKGAGGGKGNIPNGASNCENGSVNWADCGCKGDDHKQTAMLIGQAAGVEHKGSHEQAMGSFRKVHTCHGIFALHVFW